MRTPSVAVILVMASSGPARADDCETFYRRLKPHVQATYELTDAQLGDLVAKCRDDVKADHAKAVAEMQCVLVAKDDAGVKDCWADMIGTPLKKVPPKIAADCALYLKRVRPAMEARLRDVMPELVDELARKEVNECRIALTAKTGGSTLQLVRCVLAAKDDAAGQACWIAAMARSESDEAEVQLRKLQKNLQVSFQTNAEFPTGKAGPTPSGKACCKQAGQRCAASTEWTRTPAWTELDFRIEEPTRFQYSYASDGTTATVTAVGDLECDGKLETYTLSASVSAGDAAYKVTRPPPKKPPAKR
ncbi:MAG: hypothetical protein JNL83_22665 [Myxococcales bacterium]|nr:hypothetical protein [Myxococcales bacterium]